MRAFGDLTPGDYFSLTYSQIDGTQCPWEGRRESTEVAYSLLATCFAAFGAYGHLEHSLLGNRNGINIAGKLLLFFFCPALPLVDLVFLRALPALATRLGLLKSERIEYHIDEVGGYVTTTSRSIGFVLAQVIGMHVSYGEDSPRSVPLANNIHRRFYVKQREDSRSVRIRQAIILAFSTMQCLGAAIKGIRRLVRGSDSLVLADAETLWFAISGLLIFLCSWASFIQNQRWMLHESEDTMDDGRSVDINTMAVLLLCSLFSIFSYMEFDHSSPFWHVGFFHFLMPVPYTIGNNLYIIDPTWTIRRRMFLGKVLPFIISATVPIFISIIPLYPANHILRTGFWISGTIALATFGLSPILQIFWDLELIPYRFAMLFGFRQQEKWIVRFVALFIRNRIIAIVMIKTKILLLSRWSYAVLCYITFLYCVSALLYMLFGLR